MANEKTYDDWWNNLTEQEKYTVWEFEQPNKS